MIYGIYKKVVRNKRRRVSRDVVDAAFSKYMDIVGMLIGFVGSGALVSLGFEGLYPALFMLAYGVYCFSQYKRSSVVLEEIKVLERQDRNYQAVKRRLANRRAINRETADESIA